MPETSPPNQPAGDTPLVSIGLPVYNGQEYVAECIEAVLAQTFEDLELVVCDNCSTDRTPEIVRACAARDARVRYVRNERNLGSNGNFNRVVGHCRGKYFKWQSHDDVIRPGYLAATVAALEADDEVVVAHCQTEVIDADGNTLACDIDPLGGRTSGRRVERFRWALRDLFCYDIYGLMRRDALDKTRLMVDFRGGDKTLLVEMALLGRYWRADAPLFARRVHANMSGAMTGAQKRAQSAFSGRMPYRFKAFVHYFQMLRRHGVSGVGSLAFKLEILKMGLAYPRWYKLVVPGPSNYLGIDGRGKPDAGTAGEGGLLVRIEEQRRANEAAEAAEAAEREAAGREAGAKPPKMSRAEVAR